MSVFISILKISKETLDLLRSFPEAGKILSYCDEFENPDDWETQVKVIVGKKGLENLEPVHACIPQLIKDLKGVSAESPKGGFFFLYEDFEGIATPEEIEYLITMSIRAPTFEHLEPDFSYWTVEDVARMAEIISRIDNPSIEDDNCEEEEIDPLTYIINAAKERYAMLLTVC